MPICIAGMHRSATSMITRLLYKCGLYLGDEKELVPPQADNPEGFWEHVRFHSINERVLRAFQGSWDNPPSLPPGWQFDSRLDDLRKEAADLVSEFAGYSNWGWKDPRNSLTLPLWIDLVPDLRVLVPVRHPSEIAASMEKRGYSSSIFGVNLTTTYSESLEADTVDVPTLYTHQAVYFLDPAPEIQRIVSFCELAPTPVQIQESLETISVGLRHSTYVLSDLVRSDLPAKALLQYLKDCSKCGPNYMPLLLKQVQELANPENRLRERIDELKRKVSAKELENYHLQQALELEMFRNKDDGALVKHQIQTEVVAAVRNTREQAFHILDIPSNEPWEGALIAKRDEFLGIQARSGSLLAEIARLNAETGALRAEAANISANLNAEIHRVHEAYTRHLAEITTSRPWTIGQRIVRLKEKLAPAGSTRMRLISLSLRVLRRLRADGPKGVARSLRNRFRPRPTPVVEIAQAIPSEPEQIWYDVSQGIWNAIRAKEDQTKRLLTPERPKILDFDANRLAEHAASVKFVHQDQPVVSIVIPVYGQVKYTLECLASILMFSGDASYEVIVVDDGSPDETEELVGRIENLKFIRNPENLGFLRSCNRAAQEARGEYILLLNNDAQVTSGWLTALLQTFETFPDVGAVGPKVLFPDGRLQEAGAIILPNCTTQMIGYEEDATLPKFNYIRKVDYCSGVCLLVRSTEYRDLGGLSEEFAPAYCEDVDLCLRLKAKGLHTYYNPHATIVHHFSVTSNNIANSYKHQLSIRNQQKLAETSLAQIDELNKVRVLAFYLPQFHPFPENNEWWGNGFTEWSNVTKGKPNFQGHYQPHLPSDLGFYDLRVPEVMVEQAKLAKRYGIDGFCFYYYWFHGKRLLELPIERMLETNSPDIPFCLCWANENWTRRWDGLDKEVLMAQEHSDEDDKNVILDLIRFFRHKNYIRIDGKPLLIVYRVELFPDISRTSEIWRETCRAEGIGEIYLALAETFVNAPGTTSPTVFGFDGSMEFPPHGLIARVAEAPPGLSPNYTGTLLDYDQAIMMYVDRPSPKRPRFRSVMTAWDNTARQQDRASIYVNSTPEAYRAWLEYALRESRKENFGDERIVFVNAWNEWAEGAHLEPDRKYGHAYLEMTRLALEERFLAGSDLAKNTGADQ